jgi:alginate export protein
MFRIGCRAHTALIAVVAIGIGTAQAHQMIYDQDGYRLAIGIEAGLGGFLVGNVDTGAGNINTDALLEGPFPSSVRRTTRDWFEGFGKPFAELETPFFGFGHSYALVSMVGALSRGNGDALSSLAPQAARSTTSDAPQHAALEDAVIGWHSGDLFADTLGEDAIELSGGRQSFVLGDAFLIGTGVANGFGRAALYLQPRASFDHVALLKLNLSPVRARLFNLENRVNQDLMQGFDQPKSQFFGLDIGLFAASEAEPSPKIMGQKQAPKAAQAVQTTREKKDVPDLWSAGFEFFHFYDADSTPETFSFPPGEPSPALSIFGNRKGLNVYSGYLAGSLFEFDRNILLYSQFALERNDAIDRRVQAAAWYVEPGYKFSTLPWSPQLNLRYAHFSGDPNPNDRLKQSYDPLFNTGGSRGFGSWFLGEIFGQYISANTNLNLEMVHLKFSPLDTLDTGILYYNFRFDQTAQLNNPLITSKNAAQEVDFYSVWSATEWLTVTGVIAFAVPGAGLKQAAQAFVLDNRPVGRSVGRTMTLAELFVAIKY